MWGYTHGAQARHNLAYRLLLEARARNNHLWGGLVRKCHHTPVSPHHGISVVTDAASTASWLSFASSGRTPGRGRGENDTTGPAEHTEGRGHNLHARAG